MDERYEQSDEDWADPELWDSLADPLDPEQGLRAEPSPDRYCPCGRPVVHAQLNHSAVCACGRPINEED